MTTTDHLKNFYNRTSHRFWNPTDGPVGRDLVVYPLMDGLGGALLEYGCGSGSLLLHLAKEERFNQIVGIDISEEVLSNLNKVISQQAPQIKEKIKLYHPDADMLPNLMNESFDIIISVATIEHVLDPYIVLDELYRIAKPGATLICSVPNYAYIKHRLTLLAGKLPRTGTDDPVENWRQCGWDGMHIHTFTENAFSILLNDCGWQPVKWTGWGDRFPWLLRFRQRYPRLLSGELMAACVKK